IDALTTVKIRLFGSGFIILSILNAFQGAGLLLRLQWAGFLVICEDFIFIPFEVYEAIRKPGPQIFLVILINALIASYLLRHWFIFQEHHRLKNAKNGALSGL